MAMAMKGRKRHYRWARIEPRHFLGTADSVAFSAERASAIIADVLDRAEPAISAVESTMPAGFPAKVLEPILKGVRQQVNRLARFQSDSQA